MTGISGNIRGNLSRGRPGLHQTLSDLIVLDETTPADQGSEQDPLDLRDPVPSPPRSKTHHTKLPGLKP